MLVQAAVAMFALAACGPGAPADDTATSADAAANSAAEVAGGAQATNAGTTAAQVPRTADPVARGLSESDFPRVQEIADGVYTYEQLRSAGDERFTTVSMFVVTDEGVLVADGQGNDAETALLVETIAGITSQPIRHIVICSDHGDHTGGNRMFLDEATFYVHPTSAAALGPPEPAAGRPPHYPPPIHEHVPDQRVLELGGRTIEILFLGRAHTGGDLVVHLPEEKVLFMSEAYLNRVFPAMRSAYPSEWLAMLDRAIAMDIDVYVPGHGFVEQPAVLEEELLEYRRALAQVIDVATRLHAAGLGIEEATEQADFGDLETWSLRSSQGPTAIRRVFAELNGELGG